MEGCRRLSFCTCPHRFADPVSRGAVGLRRQADRWRRRARPCRRRRGRKCGSRCARRGPPSLHPTQCSQARCRRGGSPACNSASCPRGGAEACSAGSGAPSRAGGSCDRPLVGSGRHRSGHGDDRRSGCGSWIRWRDRLGHGYRDWKRHRTRNGWGTGNQLSANADAVFPAAPACSRVAQGLSPDRLLRR